MTSLCIAKKKCGSNVVGRLKITDLMMQRVQRLTKY